MKLFYLFVVLHSCFFITGHSFLFGPTDENQQVECQIVDEDFFSMMSSKTDYSLYANTNEESDDFTMPGCEPIGLWHLSRHGARYPDTEDIVEMNEILPLIVDDILSRDNSWLCESDKIKLKNWQSRLKPEYDTLLTVKGKTQQRQLGERMQKRLSDLVKKIEHNDQISVQATEKVRTQESASSYLDGFVHNILDIKPNITINYDEDYLLKFPDICGFYNKIVKKNKTACPEVAQFESSREYLNVMNTFKNRINTSLNHSNEELFDYALKMCQYEYLIDGAESVWCKFFDEKIMQVISYREDISYNCKYGYRHQISKQMTCDLISDIVQSLQSFKNDGLKKVKLFFAHTSTSLPLLTALGVSENKGNNFDYNNIANINKRREYKISDLDPMNANVALVAYRCSFEKPMSERFPDHFVKVFRNEKAIKLSACGNEKNCDLNKFLEFFGRFVSECGSSKEVCKLV